MKTLLLLLLFIFYSFGAYSQNKDDERKMKFKNLEINVINVSNAEFYELLDTLLYYEHKCSYYSDTLSYGVWIERAPTNKGDSVVVIVFIGNSDKDFIIKNRGEKLLGYVSYEGHDFFIKGQAILDSIIVTNKKNSFKCRENLSPDEDDRWTIYRFLYFKKRFILFEKENDWLCN